MTRRFESSVALAGSILALLVLGASTSAGAPAVVSGKLKPAASKLPRSAKAGSAQVMAMNIDSGAYGDADNVGRNGRFSLRLPPGKWAIRSSVVVPGKPYKGFLSAAITTKSGQKRTMPLTLKKFKKPRKRRGRKRRRPGRRRPGPARRSNVNPRDGRAYPGVAYALKEFDIASGNPAFGVLRRGLADMILTDLVARKPCEFTLVEWIRRADIEREIRLQQSEYFDPATRQEPGHLIDPEVFIRGRVEDRPGTPPRHAMLVWLEDAETGARISGDVSIVFLEGGLFAAEERLAKLVLRDLICARAATPTTPTSEPPPPPAPKPVTNVYTGTFSGEADAVESELRFKWSGSATLDAAQDLSVPPPGGPPGDYRLFTLTSGNVHIEFESGDAECGAKGSGSFPLSASNGYLWVQLDVDSPAYLINFIINGALIEAEKEGTDPECEGTFMFPAFEALAYTEEARVSPSTALNDSETHTSPIPTGWDYTTRWNLSPG